MSAASPKLQEPSMEEILASIRRIIAEDQAGAAQRPPVPPLTAALRSRELPDAVNAAPAAQVTALPAREPARPGEPTPAAATSPEAPAMVSGATEAAVEEAFGRLAATAVPPAIRSLEEAVGEMLRPMLKSWLDDNLPALVERLVKAEIERLTRSR
jgi:cell pole-organizing protein PopZ